MRYVLLVSMFTAAIIPCCAAPPPNDTFTNRTILSGSSITFTGSLAEALAGALLEPYGYPFYPVREPSVWWSWTSTESVPVVFQFLQAPTNGQFWDCFVVYTNDAASAG